MPIGGGSQMQLGGWFLRQSILVLLQSLPKWRQVGCIALFFSTLLFLVVSEQIFFLLNKYVALVFLGLEMGVLFRLAWRYDAVLRWWDSLDPWANKKPRKVPPEDQWLAETTEDPDWQ